MRPDSENDDLRASPAYQLWLASNAWLRIVRRALEPLDLTHAQYVVLASTMRLTKGAQHPSQAEVCRFAALDENMASQVVKVLMEKGFIERLRHPADGRAHALKLTEIGSELTLRAREAVKPATERFFARLGDEIPAFTALLQTLNEREDG